MSNIHTGVTMKLEGKNDFSQMFLKYVYSVIDNGVAR
jgi:hypothetical protein